MSIQNMPPFVVEVASTPLSSVAFTTGTVRVGQHPVFSATFVERDNAAEFTVELFARRLWELMENGALIQYEED